MELLPEQQSILVLELAGRGLAGGRLRTAGETAVRVAPGADVALPVTARRGAFEDGFVEGEYCRKRNV